MTSSSSHPPQSLRSVAFWSWKTPTTFWVLSCLVLKMIKKGFSGLLTWNLCPRFNKLLAHLNERSHFVGLDWKSDSNWDICRYLRCIQVVASWCLLTLGISWKVPKANLSLGVIHKVRDTLFMMNYLYSNSLISYSLRSFWNPKINSLAIAFLVRDLLWQ